MNPTAENSPRAHAPPDAGEPEGERLSGLALSLLILFALSGLLWAALLYAGGV